jgi:hypothetical protein
MRPKIAKTLAKIVVENNPKKAVTTKSRVGNRMILPSPNPRLTEVKRM